MQKQLTALCTSLLLALPSTAALADDNEILQNCLLEGKVTKHHENGTTTVYVDFYKAEPYKPKYRCILDGVLEFKQPKGSIIENLSEGSVVQYQYIKLMDGQTSWQLVGAFI